MDDAFDDVRPDTLLAHGGVRPEPASGAVVPSVHPSTTFARGDDYELPGAYIYARYGSPGYEAVERLACRLDGGADALLFGSGMAAITTLFEAIEPGRHLVAPRVMYHGAQDWLRRLSERRGMGLTLFEAGDPGALREAVRPGETAIVWIETPVNPTWDVIDIADAATVAHEAGAILAVDSTVSPPVTTRPLEVGADLVFHSATKYLNGHSDLLAGLIVTARDDGFWQEVRGLRTALGGVAGPFESWLLLRGMRTLALRFRQASASALALARWLDDHPAVEQVLYPGLESHPGHVLARRQMSGGFGGMLSIRMRGGEAAARAVARSTKIFVPATSLGGVESLIEHRAAVEGAASVVPRDLLRLSVGIEHPDDLVRDLARALGKA